MHVCSWAPGHKLVRTAGAVPVVGQGQDDLQATAKIEKTDEERLRILTFSRDKPRIKIVLAVSFPVEPNCCAS